MTKGNENPPSWSPACLMLTKKFSAWVYWEAFCHFWPINSRNIFLGIYFYHSFYGMISRLQSNHGKGVHFHVLMSSVNNQQKYFFHRKLNVQFFTLWIWTVEFWIWFIWKLEGKAKIYIVFKNISFLILYL